MAGFRQSPKAVKAARARTVKARVRAIRENPESPDPVEERSRRAAKQALSEKGDFSRILADRELRYIENRSAFFGGKAQEERLKYLEDVFAAAADEYNDTGSLMSFVMAVGPTLVMMHQTGGIRNGFSEMWHMKMADQAKAWAEADPKRFGAFYAQCQAYKDGSRLPYDAHTAALDSVALDARHYADIRKPGISQAELARIEDKYQKDKADLGAMIELDGVSPEDLLSQQHKLVATLVVRDPKYAAMYGICPGSKEYQEAVKATGAEFGPNGQGTAPVEMHAADTDLNWPANKYLEPKSVKDLNYYQETMRTGVAAFEAIDPEATKGASKDRLARMGYWTTRMTADGISRAKAQEAVKAAEAGAPKVADEAPKGLKVRFAGFREKAMAAVASVRERFQPKCPAMATVKGKADPDYVQVGDRVIDLTTGRAAPEGTKGVAPEDRDWAAKGGLREYFAVFEARMDKDLRKDIMVRELRRFQGGKNEKMTAAQAMLLYNTEEGRDRLVRDGMLQDIREKVPEAQRDKLPESFAYGDEYDIFKAGRNKAAVMSLVNETKVHGSKAVEAIREASGQALDNTRELLEKASDGTKAVRKFASGHVKGATDRVMSRMSSLIEWDDERTDDADYVAAM